MWKLFKMGIHRLEFWWSYILRKNEEKEYNALMIKANCSHWNFKKQIEFELKYNRRDKKLKKAISLLQELIDENVISNMDIGYEYDYKNNKMIRGKSLNIEEIMNKPI